MALRTLILAISAAFLVISCKNKVEMPADDSANPPPAAPTKIEAPSSLMIEEGQQKEIEISLSTSSNAPRTLIWEVLDSKDRFENSTGTLQFPANQRRASFILNLLSDSIYSGDQRVRVEVREPKDQIAKIRFEVLAREIDSIPYLSVQGAKAPAGSQMQFQVVLTAASASKTEFEFATYDATARAGQDYVAKKGKMTLPPGARTGLILIDTLRPPVGSDPQKKFFRLELSKITNAGAGVTSAAGEIEPPSLQDSIVQFQTASAKQKEADIVVQVPILLNSPSSKEVRVQLSIEGEAELGKDFQITSDQVVIPAGQTQALFQIHLLDDSLFEAPEALVLRMIASQNAAIGELSQYRLQIEDNDPLPEVSVLDAQTNEGGDLEFVVRLNQPSGADVQLYYKTDEDSATSSDFEMTAGSLTIPKGQTAAKVVVHTKRDGIHEETERMLISISNVRNAVIAKGSASGLIVDSDPAPALQFSSAQSRITQKGEVEVALELSFRNGVDTLVLLNVGGSAQQGVDHNLASQIVRIPAGEMKNLVRFQVLEVGSNPKVIHLKLENPKQATLGSQTEHQVVIQQP